MKRLVTTRLWDPASGKEIMRWYQFKSDHDWHVVTPEGFFDGSPGALRLITWFDGKTDYPGEAFRAHFQRPGSIAKALALPAP